jgi:hypothetical protein
LRVSRLDCQCDVRLRAASRVWRSASIDTPPPLVLIAWLMLPLASAAATSLLPGFAVLAWREQWWTRGARLRFSTMAVLSVAFLTFLNYWKLFGVS